LAQIPLAVSIARRVRKREREASTRRGIDSSHVRVVVVTSSSDRDAILAALDSGEVDNLLKHAKRVELIRGPRAAARGESAPAPRAAHAVLEPRHGRRPAQELSEREREVLALLGQGLPNKLIARELSISEKTVKAHVTRIFQVLDVTDRTQAALWAQRHGIG
jgi:DNA-binding NarL/FixJ family response regulator